MSSSLDIKPSIFHTTIVNAHDYECELLGLNWFDNRDWGKLDFTQVVSEDLQSTLFNRNCQDSFNLK